MSVYLDIDLICAYYSENHRELRLGRNSWGKCHVRFPIWLIIPYIHQYKNRCVHSYFQTQGAMDRAWIAAELCLYLCLCLSHAAIPYFPHGCGSFKLVGNCTTSGRLRGRGWVEMVSVRIQSCSTLVQLPTGWKLCCSWGVRELGEVVVAWFSSHSFAMPGKAPCYWLQWNHLVCVKPEPGCASLRTY